MSTTGPISSTNLDADFFLLDQCKWLATQNDVAKSVSHGNRNVVSEAENRHSAQKPLFHLLVNHSWLRERGGWEFQDQGAGFLWAHRDIPSNHMLRVSNVTLPIVGTAPIQRQSSSSVKSPAHGMIRRNFETVEQFPRFLCIEVSCTQSLYSRELLYRLEVFANCSCAVYFCALCSNSSRKVYRPNYTGC